jgi:nucleoredoxin
MRYFMWIVIVAVIVSTGCKKKAGAPETGTKTNDTSAQKDEPPKEYHKKVEAILAGNLVDSSGATVGVERLTTKKYLLVYYSAHWCPPCRSFTPKLVNWYNKNHDDYEVVFVSSDRSEAKMLAYMKEAKMPWVAVKYRTKAHRDMAQFRKGGGIPCLVLLDTDDKRLAGSYDNAGKKYLGAENAYEKLKPLIQKK